MLWQADDDGQVRSTATQHTDPSRLTPAVLEQRRRSTLEFHSYQRRADSQRLRRLTCALLLSLLFHALLLSLTLGGEGFGLPGFGFPWKERRIEATDLNVVLVPEQVAAAEPSGAPVKGPMQASIAQPVAGAPAVTPSLSPAPPPGSGRRRLCPSAKRTPRAKPTAEAKPEATPPRRERLPRALPLQTEGSGDATPAPIPEPAVIAVERTDEAALVVPAAPSEPTAVIAAAPNVPSVETVIPPRKIRRTAQERT